MTTPPYCPKCGLNNGEGHHPLCPMGAETDPATGDWYAASDIDRMVREIDVAMNGDGAARQARLCDIRDQVIAQVAAGRGLYRALRGLVNDIAGDDETACRFARDAIADAVVAGVGR